MDVFDGLFEFGAIVGVTVSGWIVTRQVRSRMSKTLGKTPTDLELASLKTWMKVDETEQKSKEGEPIHPK